MKVQLKESHVSFEDLETGFSVQPGQVVELDPDKKKGKLTLRMIKSGGLIEVQTAAEKTTKNQPKRDAPK